MLANIKYYACPENITDVIKELKKGKGKYAVLAGGTSIALNRMPQIQGLISLKKTKLEYIQKTKTGLKIGSMTKIQDILENRITKSFAQGLLYKTCYNIGSTLNRHLITLGGNIVQIYKWSDLPVALLILDTNVVIKNTQNKTVKFTDFLKKHPKTVLKPGSIVIEIYIKNPKGKFGTEFISFSKTEFDYTLCDVAVYIEKKGDKCKDFRIAYGGVKPLPFRADILEKMMKNQKINKDLIEQVSLAAGDISPSADFRVSKEYKRHLIYILTKRAINSALSKIK